MNEEERENKVAIVTGAAGGIGGAVVARLAREGMKVFAVDSNEVGLYDLVATLKDDGMDVYAKPADLRLGNAVEELVAEVDSCGPIDVLVNGAGNLRMGPLVECSDDDWASTFDVNVTSAFRMSRATALRMIQRRRGAIVSVASNAAIMARKGMGAYGASKAALESLTKTLGLELSEYGIRCNLVAPGSTDTAMLRTVTGVSHDSVISGILADFKPGIPLRKVAQPSDVASAVSFLLSADAAHITMHTLVVDGGATLGR